MIDERQRRLMELARRGERHLPQPPAGEGWISGHREIRSCGDAVTLHLQLREGRILDARYTGDGCALSLASAELIAEALAGREPAAAQELLSSVWALLNRSSDDKEVAAAPEIEDLAVVLEYPARKGCVLLAVEAALDALSAVETN